MIISDEVYNCLINQAIVMKMDSEENSEEIAKKVVEEYLDGEDVNSFEKQAIIDRIDKILKD